MPFIPHTPDDVAAMLDTIGVKSIDGIFDEIPARIRAEGLKQTPEGLSEMAVHRLMSERAAQDSGLIGFLGAGVATVAVAFGMRADELHRLPPSTMA